MEKWQEIAFITLSNLCVAVVAGGFLKLLFDKGNEISATIVMIIGAYIGIGAIVLAKNIEKRS